jgi:phosphatidate cytidylyltransferase
MPRVLSGAVMGAAMAAAVWWLGSLALLAIAELVLVAAFVEYAAIAERLNARVPRVPAAVAAMLTCAAMAVPGQPVGVVLMAAVPALGVAVLGSGRASADTLHDMAAALLPALYLGLPLGALVATHAEAGRGETLLLLATVVVSDTAQYYTGRTFGRRLLAPAISPKKTVEGAVGGLAFGAAAVVVIGTWWLPAVGPVARGALGLVVAALGIVGDLFESLLKRGAGVKDASSLIPGHGGVLDRVDALLFAAPAYYVFVKYVY